MHDPNEEIVMTISRAALRRMVEDVWHDSAVETGRRLVEAAIERDAMITGYVGTEPCHVGTWNHLFVEDGRERERECSIAMASDGRVVAMTITRDGKERDATDEEIADVERSLADNDVTDRPEEHDLFEGELPAWASDQIVQRVTASARGTRVS